MAKEGLSNQTIAKQMNRDKNITSRFISNPNCYGKNHNTQNNEQILPNGVKTSLKSASDTDASASQLKSELNLPAGKCQIQRILSNSERLVYSMVKAEPPLTKEPKSRRFQWGMLQHNRKKHEWRLVVWSGEKN